MKKLIYIGLIASLSLASCSDDFLNRPPLNSVSEDTFWKSENDVYLAVNTIYAALPGEGVMFDDGATDLVHAQYGHESVSNAIASGIVNTSLDAGWSYEDKRKANYFLDNVDQAEMDEKLKERYKAEVRFIRAYSYFRMLIKFGDIPLVTTTLDFSEDELNIPRTPKAQVLDFILTELEQTAKILPVSYSGGRGQERGRVTKGAALALKSRVHLYAEQYEATAATAKDVMALGYNLFQIDAESEVDALDNYSNLVDFEDESQETSFRLALRSYEGLFHQTNEGNNEVILDRQYIQEAQTNFLNTYLREGSVGGWSSLSPTQNLIDAYQSFITGEKAETVSQETRKNTYAKEDKTDFVKEFRNRDPRFYASILFETAPWNALTLAGGYSFVWKDGDQNMSKTGYNFRKMIDPKASRDNLANHSNIILLRYAEVLLNYAEAQNEVSGPDETIYEAIDAIRARAGMPALDKAKYGSKETLREAIRQERTVELALEGVRYMDIRRWKTAPTVMTSIYDVKGNLAQERIWDDKLYLMPVPQSQIDLAYGVLEQNEGYN